MLQAAGVTRVVLTDDVVRRLAFTAAALEKDPELRPRSRAHVLEIYRGHLAAMRQELPRLFGRSRHRWQE